ncbi:uncharacterized protein [Nicotiana tomentosiformis]|uniref:uncharacterized protein n=1 Tax=Nicotiana tomentosiformis TaxID=4098 RepID=UPI00388C9EB7
MNRGSTNVWHENWIGLGALYHIVPNDYTINEDMQEVAELRVDDTWDEQLLVQSFPTDIAQHIKQEVIFGTTENSWDVPRWMPSPSGNFSVSSAWNILRHRDHVNPDYNKIWTKDLPFKISFFLWILWKGKIPTDNLWRRSGYLVVSKCWCCSQPQEETFQHLFLTSETTTRVWRNFLQAADLVINLVQVHQVIRTWWNAKCYPKLMPLYQAAPAVITWEL